jgi:hypothetical protein
MQATCLVVAACPSSTVLKSIGGRCIEVNNFQSFSRFHPHRVGKEQSRETEELSGARKQIIESRRRLAAQR